MVLEPMMVCGKGGEVFMVPPSGNRESLKRPTHKEPGEGKKKKKAQQRNIANGAK